MILLGDRLSAQMLFNAEWIVRAAFNRSVVGHYHTFLTVNSADPGYYAGGIDLFVINIKGG
jgi:hypothetical protein